MEALVEEVAFELGFHGLLGLRHAEPGREKISAERVAEGDGLGVPSLPGRPVTSSIRSLVSTRDT